MAWQGRAFVACTAVGAAATAALLYRYTRIANRPLPLIPREPPKTNPKRSTFAAQEKNDKENVPERPESPNTANTAPPVTHRPRYSRSLTCMLSQLQDASMLFLVLGLSLLLLLLLASLAFVGMDARAASPAHTKLFATLLSLALVLFLLGFGNVFFRPQRKFVPIAAGLKRSESLYQASEKAMESKEKVSQKCPFGFG